MEKIIGVGRIAPAVIIHTTLHIPANIEYIVNIMQKNTTGLLTENRVHVQHILSE